MTEEKQKEIPKENPKEPEVPKVLEETLRRIIKEEIKQAPPQNPAQTSQNISNTSEPQPEPKHEHWTAEGLLKEIEEEIPKCTTGQCKAEKQKMEEAFGKPYMEKHWRDKLPYVCAKPNCGEGVMRDEDEKCPKCGERNYKKRA